MKNFKQLITGVFASVMLFAASEAMAITIVDVSLALVIDVSKSVRSDNGPPSDYSLQMNGYRDAFQSAQVKNNIASLTNGVRVEVFFYSGGTKVGGIEALLTTAAESDAFGTAIGNLARPTEGEIGIHTNIAAGMALANTWLTDAEFVSSELIMDVSGDGPQNRPADQTEAQYIALVQAERDAAALAGITVNGLPIDNIADENIPFLDGCNADTGYYTNNVITPDGDCFHATGFDTFFAAVQEKIEEETIIVPEPATLALFGIGLAGLSLRKRKLA